MARLLKIQTDYFRAGAVWTRVYGVWSCTKAAPIIRWMVGKSVEFVHLELLKMGATYRWVGLPKLSDNRKPASFAGATVNRDSITLNYPVADPGERQFRGNASFDRAVGGDSKASSQASRKSNQRPIKPASSHSRQPQWMPRKLAR